ncbi:DNA cytosine methyltransferase [Sulfurospirillum sp. 'SP']|nr:DNA cytosine methyltransferase [Sulfurospirillum sp. 'SP']WNY99490.1 DNA cytosine methyltransferase [Sulfurospirillum sp. 'SP']
MEKKPTVIDLFCGCGGLSLGFLQAGYDVVLGIDNCKNAIETFTKNHKNSTGLVADLSAITPKDISLKTGIAKIDVIIGGPPCQGYSIAGKRIIEDSRNELYKSFVKFVEYFEPQAFLMENVPNILSIGNGAIKNNIINDFSGLGYKVVCKVLLASDFGVPQNRKRAFFIGLKNNIEFQFPILQNNIVTAAEAISDLPEDTVVDGMDYPSEATSTYQKLMRKNSKAIYNHLITQHKDTTKQIIALVPDGGNYKSLPVELQKTRKVNIAWTRLNSKKPSFTIDTGHNHHFHYKFNRVPTVRESARIQSFPDDFIFVGTLTSQLRQVGNAVPPLFAKILAKSLKNSIRIQ